MAKCEIDGATLEIGIGAYGQTIVRCPGCAARKAKRCMDCGAPVVGKSWRCEAHKRARHAATKAKCEKRHREQRRAAARKRYRKMSPERRAAKAATKRAWREKNRLKVLMHKRRGRLAGTNGYRTREKYLAYQDAYNAGRAEAKRIRMRELARERSPWRDRGPTCRECGAVIEWNRLGRPRVRCLYCVGARRQEAA